MDRERYQIIMQLISQTDQAFELLKEFKDDIRRIVDDGPDGNDKDKVICRLCAWWCWLMLLGQ